MAHILVVDDHRDTCRLLTRLLRELGYDVVAVLSGQAALDHLDGARSAASSTDKPATREDTATATETARPSLVLLDVMMPEMDGFETLRRLRARPETHDMPVVMLSALADDESQDRAAQLGATGYWVKGAFEFERFSEMLAPYLPPPQLPGGGPPPPDLPWPG